MTAPVVSVVIPVYNYEAYITTTIESVYAQTFTDWELIVVDDHSTDRTEERVRWYEDDPRVRVTSNERNLGQFETHNRGAALARGKYIKVLHGDDVMYPHCLEIMVALMEAYPDAGLGISHDPWPWVAPKLLTPEEAWRLHVAGASSVMAEAPSGTIFRTDAFRRTRGYDTRFFGSSDVCLNLEISMRDSVLLLPCGLWWYRLHESQNSVSSVKRDVRPRERLTWYPELLDRPENPLSVSERTAARRATKRDFLRICRHHLLRGRLRRAASLWRGGGLPASAWFSLFSPAPEPARFEYAGTGISHWSPFPGSPAPSSRTAGEPPPYGRCAVNREVAPAVSFLIPACGAEAHLADAVESVLAQRFSDWELVIVDDASTDGTTAVAQRYADESRVRAFRNEEALGTWANHNRCAELARGAYLKFLHPDDLLYPHCIATMLGLMRSHPEAGLGISGPCGPYRSGVVLEPRMAQIHEFLGTPRFLEGPTALIIRADLFREAGGFDSNVQPCQRHLQLRLAAAAPVVLINEGLTYRRSAPASHHAGSSEWPLGWAQGFEWLVRWVVDDAVHLKDDERQHAVGNLLRFAWRRGDPYLPLRLTPRALSLRERGTVLRLAREFRIPYSSFMRGPRNKTAPEHTIREASSHRDRILFVAPDWTGFHAGNEAEEQPGAH